MIPLQAVAPYKSKLPKSEDETEYIENLFNALCSTLMTERNRHVSFKLKSWIKSITCERCWGRSEPFQWNDVQQNLQVLLETP